MTTLIFIVAAVLILAVILTIFRVATLVGIVRGDSKKYVPSGNKTQAILMMVFLIAGVSAFFYYSFGGVEDYTQPLASEHGAVTDNLFWITMGITVFVFIVTHIFLFGFAWKYQHKKERKADFYPHNNKLEMIWTVIPAIVLAILIFSGLRAWNEITGPAPENAEVIEVMGYQYAWAFRYGGNVDGQIGKYDFRKIDVVNQVGIDFTDKRNFDDFMANQLILPKGRPVELKIRARDVIHSVYSPHFRIQMNAVPGHPTRFWFTPTKSTAEMRTETGNEDFNYELVCNKICGANHFGMKATITVLDAEEYDEWFANQKAWLNSNPEYLDEVPEDLREAAKIAAAIEEEQEVSEPVAEVLEEPASEEALIEE
jgi:cytochrome c oxidase subunit 2